MPPLYPTHVTPGALSRPVMTPFAGTDKDSVPTRMTGNRIDGIDEVEVSATGDALLERGDDLLRADRIVYRRVGDEVLADGNVRLDSPDATVTGSRLHLRMNESRGAFELPAYILRRQLVPMFDQREQGLAATGEMTKRQAVIASGAADRLEFLGANQYRLENASYSTCAPARRDWELKVDSLDLDYDSDVATARHATVRFKETPVIYLPWLSFPLSNQRKSGFLSPTYGTTSNSGIELSMPWYWNIAPNMDATITPRHMIKRGTQIITEFRYLKNAYRGQVHVEYLPNDALARRDRGAYSLVHSHDLGHGFSAAVDFNGVSDDNYSSDLSSRVDLVSRGNLLRQGVLSYNGSWYGATLNVQTYQTLQGLDKPYQRLPQLSVTANRYDLPLGLNFGLNAEYVNFDHPEKLLAKRTTLYPQLSLPLATSSFWLTPKIGLHSARYQLDRQYRLAVGDPFRTVSATQERTVPITSIDGGFVMERVMNWFGQPTVLTLEPRAFYLYVPVRDQRDIPVFDTGITGFSYSQMFAENRYSGGDRIGDANQLTLVFTSRLLDPDSGEEYLRASFGQQQYFSKQRVALPDETIRTARRTDILTSITGRLRADIHADFGWRYNPREGRAEQLAVGGSYRPAAGKVINAGYRFARDKLGQIDVSVQWPLSGKWHGVGRYNYSTKDRRAVKIIGGLEYDAGCWIGRLVVQRLATIADRPTSALFVQLELNDFFSIGSNPLELLKRNIPGYGTIDQSVADPVFGAH